MNKNIEVQFKKTRLFKPYLSKKIESGTLQKVLNSTYQTAYRLYLISNEIKELQEFAAIDATIVFNTPNYKVWVGNFRTRIEAERNVAIIKDRYKNVLLIKPSK